MLKPFEKSWAVVMLLFGSQALGLLLVGPVTDTQRMAPASNSFALVVNIGFHVVAAVFYVFHARTLIRTALGVPWLFVLVTYASCSAAWSQDPDLTFRRSIILFATTLFGIYFGSRFELKEQIDLLAVTLLLILVASAALAIVSPRLGVESGSLLGDWKGVFSQKNVLGRIAVMALITFAYWRPPFRFLRYFAIVFAVGILGMTRSGTALVVVLMLAALVPLFRLLRTNPILLVPIGMVAMGFGAAAGALLLSHADIILALLGRNATLTGRTELWQACLNSIMKRPLLGYGFDAFWLGMTGESAIVISTVHWLVPTAHNGALDLLLSLGSIGLGLFVLVYLISARYALRFYLNYENHLRAWPLTFLTFFFLYNITEVTEMEQNSIFMMLFAAVAATVSIQSFASKKITEIDEDYKLAYGLES
jgi:exopolysaccharide production protein ExoQ